MGLHEAHPNESRASDSESSGRHHLSSRIDFGPLVLDRTTDDTFDDLIARDAWRAEPLYSLNHHRMRAEAGSRIRFVNTYQGNTGHPEYRRNLELLLNKAGFVDIAVEEAPDGQIIECVRRPLAVEECDHNMTIREIVDPDGIMKMHEFAREYYYYKDFNYDFDVVRQFDPNSDVIAVQEPDGTVLSLVRSTLRVPGHNVPFMYACKADGSHVVVPEHHHRICEIMALYREGKRGVIAFKRVIEYLTQFLYYFSKVDSVWTTYDKSDNFTGTYYKNKFLMREFGVTLVYRDFGGLWDLIYTDRGEELHNLYRRLFRH